MADGYLSSLRSTARDARDTAEEYGRHAADRLRDRGDDARSELSHLWSQLEDLVERRIRPAASEAAGSASGYARQGRDMAHDVADQIRDVTRSRPLVAIGVAVAATWLITSMLRSGRR
ncbi:hypothetical protein [Roseicella aquatilis]|uniref:DUF883 family protein n=1 Tax=Roseicella aquatilis TaxID=2527868 RepID=A0A4R4DQ98_9PROT|nr:hypothetical protein [Roseicella aquatilis]TCZ62978.1 hypothetical protein EXY23_11400 [Roseicella aquatilis]